MESYEKLKLLKNALTGGKIDKLADHLADDCIYISDYARVKYYSASRVLMEMMNTQEHVLKDTYEMRDSSYSGEIVPVTDVLKEDVFPDSITGRDHFEVFKYGIKLFQCDKVLPAAFVIVRFDEDGKFAEINLSRNRKWFSLRFCEQAKAEDSDRDVPGTVCAESSIPDDEVYIWRRADDFVRSWLNKKKYTLIESTIFEDCIGYRFSGKVQTFALYLFAFGDNPVIDLNGEYCSKLPDLSFSEGCTVLIAYLNVQRTLYDDGYHYSVYSFRSGTDIELYKVVRVAGKTILVYYPGEVHDDLRSKFMYAFNFGRMDVFDCIMSERGVRFIDEDTDHHFYEAALYNGMHRIRWSAGRLKIGYLQDSHNMYSLMPYTGSGYFNLFSNRCGRIYRVEYISLDESDDFREFIKTDDEIDDCCVCAIPKLTDIRTLDPSEKERFALNLEFDNGERLKYVLSVSEDQTDEDVVIYSGHALTDRIWKTAKLAEKRKAEYVGYPDYGQGIQFSNDLFISVLQCYWESRTKENPDRSLFSPVLMSDEKKRDYEEKKKTKYAERAKFMKLKREKGFSSEIILRFAAFLSMTEDQKEKEKLAKSFRLAIQNCETEADAISLIDSKMNKEQEDELIGLKNLGENKKYQP